jgi:hypothetical protein
MYIFFTLNNSACLRLSKGEETRALSAKKIIVIAAPK